MSLPRCREKHIMDLAKWSPPGSQTKSHTDIFEHGTMIGITCKKRPCTNYKSWNEFRRQLTLSIIGATENFMSISAIYRTAPVPTADDSLFANIWQYEARRRRTKHALPKSDGRG